MTAKRIPKMRTRAVNPADDSFGYLGCLLVDGDRVYATGGTWNKPTLLVSDDGARTWRRLSHPRTPGLRSLTKVGDTLYLVGEYGMLAASVDSGLTWTRLPVDTQTCLFDQIRAPDGTWFIIGDEGVILRSTDGITYEQLELDWEPRLLGIRVIDKVVHVLAYDGTIRKWDGTTMVPLDFDGGTPLTDLVVTKAGSWIVTGDSGMIFRSTDRGASFDEIENPSSDDLEAILEIPQGLLIIGDSGTLLFSDDDGQTWVVVPNDMNGHLWSIEQAGSILLVGGDEGAIWMLDVSAKDTMEVSLEPADEDDKDAEEEEEEEEEEKEEEEEDDDGDGDDGDDEDDDDEDDDAIAPAHFDSIHDASARWIREGTAFSDALNGYVRRVYAVGSNKAGNEPTETRKDMADYVRQQLIALNAAGDHRKARQLFPPAYEPFEDLYDSLGQGIGALAFLRDGRKLARIDDVVYLLDRDKITQLDGADLFGQSPDRRFVAKGHDEVLDIHDGWDGPLIRTIPRGPAHAVLTKSITITPDGDAVLAATDSGIFWLTERGTKKLLPEGDGDDEDDDDNVSYPHAALSPNGRFIAMGTQDTSHLVLDRKTGRRYGFDPVSSYPHWAAFHHDRPDVVLSSCHALYGSGTLGVDLDALVAGKKQTARVLDRRAWVYQVASTKFGYLLGDRSGYIWALDFQGTQQWYAFIGSTMTAMDISPDRTKLLAGTFAGIVVELDLTAKAPDPRLLTDGPVTDVCRWLFWQGHDPMIW